MLPAYGRELLELRREGKRPGWQVYVVDNWEVARVLRLLDRFVLMVEGDALPYGFVRFRRFDFSMLQDLDVVLIPDSMEFIGHIWWQVRSFGPRTLKRTAMFFAPDATFPDGTWKSNKTLLDEVANQVAVLIAPFEAELSAA
jgi:hypothetical protein